MIKLETGQVRKYRHTGDLYKIERIHGEHYGQVEVVILWMDKIIIIDDVEIYFSGVMSINSILDDKVIDNQP